MNYRELKYTKLLYYIIANVSINKPITFIVIVHYYIRKITAMNVIY